MNIIQLAFDMADAVGLFVQKAKKFYYNVMLFGYRCPKCSGDLTMAAEGLCRCNSCKCEFDPTVQFQRCSSCGGLPVLRVRRYCCNSCGSDIRSKFLFDGLVFDRQYFKVRMAESRQRKKERIERVREMLAQSRSDTLPLEAMDLNAAPGLLEALNNLTAMTEADFEITSRDKFDLKRYESHIQAHIQDFAINLYEIPPLIENPRKDLIWRFIAVIFLAHTGIVDIWQEGSDIMVRKHVTYTEGCSIPGEIEEPDGLQGLAC